MKTKLYEQRDPEIEKQKITLKILQAECDIAQLKIAEQMQRIAVLEQERMNNEKPTH